MVNPLKVPDKETVVRDFRMKLSFKYTSRGVSIEELTSRGDTIEEIKEIQGQLWELAEARIADIKRKLIQQ